MSTGRSRTIGFNEGQDVKKGALLAQIDPRPFQAALGVAVATRDRDRAALANAHLDLQRYELLAPEDLASKQTVDTQKALIAQLSAQLRATRRRSITRARSLTTRAFAPRSTGAPASARVGRGNNVHAADSTAGSSWCTQIEAHLGDLQPARRPSDD